MLCLSPAYMAIKGGGAMYDLHACSKLTAKRVRGLTFVSAYLLYLKLAYLTYLSLYFWHGLDWFAQIDNRLHVPRFSNGRGGTVASDTPL